MENSNKNESVFAQHGIKKYVSALLAEITELYQADKTPWVVGYSGGKDSTAVLQLIWMAIENIPKDKQHKKVYVISTDTLVENPVVANWVSGSIKCMKQASDKNDLPFVPHQLKPKPEHSFWTNLIGKGYPAPRPKFRWCTARLKIWPSNEFILNTTKQHGDVLLCLGTRKKESAQRAATMEHYEEERSKEHRYGDLAAGCKVSPNRQLPNTWVYSTIQDWSNDDVWLFLNHYPNPWGYSNQDLLGLYSGATEGGECPLVIDTNTPSCGDSRFGCWVCTLVNQDRSMAAMVQNDAEKEWMLPLMEIRNMIDFRKFSKEESDRALRDFRRMNGNVQIFGDSMKYIPGPYKREFREDILRRLLEAQKYIREVGPEHVRHIELISLEELEEIRRVWVMDKHEIEDSLPGIYKSVLGISYPGKDINGNMPFSEEDLIMLKEICGNHYNLVRDLINVELQESVHVFRKNLMKKLEGSIKRNFYENEEDALTYARQQEHNKQDILDEWDSNAFSDYIVEKKAHTS